MRFKYIGKEEEKKKKKPNGKYRTRGKSSLQLIKKPRRSV